MEDVIKLGNKILFFFGFILIDLVIRKFLFFFISW